LRGIYTGELLKIAFTIALFVIAIRLLAVVFLIVVASYLAMVAINWLALLFIDVGEAPPSATPGAGSSL
jgi:F0F1-type ATP synthase assembly protein I